MAGLGGMLEVARADLAFTSEEVATLLERKLHQPPSREVALAIAAETEGWPISVQRMARKLLAG